MTSSPLQYQRALPAWGYKPKQPLEIDSNGKIWFDTMTLSDDIHHISSGDASGLSIATDSSSLVATVYIGSSLLDKMTSFFEDAVSIGSDINDMVSQFNSDIQLE